MRRKQRNAVSSSCCKSPTESRQLVSPHFSHPRLASNQRRGSHGTLDPFPDSLALSLFAANLEVDLHTDSLEFGSSGSRRIFWLSNGQRRGLRSGRNQYNGAGERVSRALFGEWI